MEFIKSVAQVLDHAIIIGSIITGYAKYLQCMLWVSDIL